MKVVLKSFKGFTLIELILVITIVSLLASGLLLIIKPSTQLNRANDARRKSDLAAIQSALEQYRFDEATYPSTNLFASCGPSSNLTGTSGVVYIKGIPCDPRAVRYQYAFDSTGGNYCLRACLANGSDAMRDDVVYSGSPPSCPVEVTACAAGTHNYTLVNQ